jgi:hypothetical protein
VSIRGPRLRENQRRLPNASAPSLDSRGTGSGSARSPASAALVSRGGTGARGAGAALDGAALFLKAKWRSTADAVALNERDEEAALLSRGAVSGSPCAPSVARSAGA